MSSAKSVTISSSPMRWGTIPRSIQVLNVLSRKQEITTKEFSFLLTVKNTYSRRVYQAFSVGVSRHLLHSQTKPQFNKNKSFPRKNVEVEQGPVILIFLCCLDEFFCSFNEDVVYFFLVSPWMSKLLSNRWLGLACLLSALDQNTLSNVHTINYKSSM